MRIVGRASSPRKGWPPATAQRAADGLDMATTRDRDCSGSSTLAPGSHNGNIRANSSYIGKKLRIQTGIDKLTISASSVARIGTAESQR